MGTITKALKEWFRKIDSLPFAEREEWIRQNPSPLAQRRGIGTGTQAARKGQEGRGRHGA